MDLGIQLAALIVCGSAMTIKDIPNLEGTIPRMEQICDLFAKDTYFSPELLVQEKKWRIYYTWNIVMADRCLDMTFQWTTAESTHRFWSDMHEYLETEPPWEGALLIMTMGTSNHQMMLFSDQGPAGRMLGVPNIRRDSNVLIPKKSVPLLKFQLKIMNINLQTFLLVMDCNTGVTTLSIPSEYIPPNTLFFYAASLAVPFSVGAQACNKDHEKFKDYESISGNIKKNRKEPV